MTSELGADESTERKRGAAPIGLRLLTWLLAAGCFYLGTVVFAEYLGGRFEGFRGPGINEANAAALLIVTGILTTFVLFLSGKKIEKITACSTSAV